jgi:hypothetical protein
MPIYWDWIVEEDHRSIADEMLKRALMREGDLAHRRLVRAENPKYFLRLRSLRERSETANVEENHRDLRSMTLKQFSFRPRL